MSAGGSGLTAGGIAFLALAWGGITAVTVFCFYKILRTRDRAK